MSTNIKNTTKESLTVGLRVTFCTGADPFTVAGTYQHAKESVTKAQSMDYKFSSSGYGGVIKFNDSKVKAKYDNMQGVKVTSSLADYFN